MRRIIEFIDWAARVHFIGTVGWAVGSWAVTFFGLSASGWDPGFVWLGSLIAGACGSLIFIGVRTRGTRPKASAEAPIGETKTLLGPDVDASVAFFDVLQNSDWSREQKPIENPVSDWLTTRLDDEIHNRLYQNRLTAWGRRCLNSKDEAPEGIIPASEWEKIEIEFGDRPRTCAIWRTKRNSTREIAYAGIKFSRKEIYAAFPPTDEEITLFEAATITYERIRNHHSSIPMEVFASSADDILISICKSLTEFRGGQEPLLKLFGNKPPSRIKERIYTDALNRWDFVIKDKTTIFREPYGHFQYENLTVKTQRLDEAIQKLMESHE